MIVLLGAGALIGPSVLGLVENPLDGVGAQLLFNIGVALILFHGGVGISPRVISRTAVGLGLLVSPGLLLTAFVVALVISPAFGASLLLARGVEGAEIAVSMVAFAVCSTLLLQATTAGYLAKRLGLIEEPERATRG